MKISQILKTERSVSFEFFPPRNERGRVAFFRTLRRLAAFRPSFVSVTYGAGGSTREVTEEMVTRVLRETPLLPMAHLTCSGQTRREIDQVLRRLESAGIQNVLALRGDPPQGSDRFRPLADGFAHATDLIRHVSANYDLGMAAACYPETHPEATSAESDLEFARQKVDLGAEFLVSQMFFDNSDYFAFVDRARRAGIDVPIIAGIMPILSAPQIRRMTALCGASIPPALESKLASHAEDDAAVREIGIEHAAAQVRQLWDDGADGIHFYVLNRARPVTRVLRRLQLPGHEGDGSGNEPSKESLPPTRGSSKNPFPLDGGRLGWG